MAKKCAYCGKDTKEGKYILCFGCDKVCCCRIKCGHIHDLGGLEFCDECTSLTEFDPDYWVDPEFKSERNKKEPALTEKQIRQVFGLEKPDPENEPYGIKYWITSKQEERI